MDEIKELNDTMKSKIGEILKSRQNSEVDEKYEITLLTIPMLQKEALNI